MNKVSGSKLHRHSGIAPKCEKYLKPLTRKKKIDLHDIGNQQNNNLLDLLKCQCKANKICTNDQKSYMKCHASVMGTGSFAGKKHCGEEMEVLFRCAMGDGP